MIKAANSIALTKHLSIKKGLTHVNPFKTIFKSN